MKRLFLTIFLIILPAFSREEILNYDVSIAVQEDGMFNIVETIRVRAEGNQIKRGIYRDFPHKVKDKYGIPKSLPFEVIKVLKNDLSEPFALESAAGGTRIRIGSADKTLQPNVYTYTIHYRTGGWMLQPSDNIHELYWNVTGDEWGFPILNSTCEVHFPAGAKVTHAEGYTGARGEQGQNYSYNIKGSSIIYQLTQPLPVRAGWTIVAQVPAGFIEIPEEKFPMKLLLFAVSGLVAIGWFIYSWFSVGIDPKKGTIIPQFTAPEGMSAAAVRYVYKTAYDNDCFTAGIVGAAQKGAVLIEENGKSFTLHNKATGDNNLCKDEQALIGKLLKGITNLQLKNKNHRRISSARLSHKNYLQKRHQGSLFNNNTKWWTIGLVLSIVTIALGMIFLGDGVSAFFAVWLSIWSIGCFVLCSQWIKAFKAKQFGAGLFTFLFSLPFLIGWFFGAFMLTQNSSPLLTAVILIMALLNIVFYHLIKAPTKKGRKVLDHIEGLKHYLSVAEKDRLNMASSPPQTATHYEEFLPYAIALGVSENWTNSFAKVLEQAALKNQKTHYSPHFYSGHFTGSDSFKSGSLIGGALGAALSSAGRSPSSSSSGSGGGGSSGGGGGGGGGGGW